MRIRNLFVGLALAGVGMGAAALGAQIPFFRGSAERMQPGMLPGERAGFTFCRFVYTPSGRREAGGSGWNTDYPMADQNLMIRLADFTTAEIARLPHGGPAHALVRATDDALFECPFLFASDVGTAGFTGPEVDRLREYLLKGGFLWVDDFWGTRAWQEWESQIGRVLPGFPIVDLEPDHPIFSSFYFVDEVPQIPSIQFWRRSGGQTSERGNDSLTPTMRAIFDERGRMVVLMTHNTDIADGWERENEDYEFFHRFSPRGYSIGINVAVYMMTH